MIARLTMGCLVGVTTALGERKTYWQNVYADVRDWEVAAGPFAARMQALEAAAQVARERGCETAPDGEEPGGSQQEWYVYAFKHAGRSQARSDR